MRQVVLDPEIVAAGIMGRARPRRLLGLIAYARWAQVAEIFGPAEEAVIQEEVRRLGGNRGGPAAEELERLGRDRKALIQESLPYGPPDDIVSVASTRLHDAVVERVELARLEIPSARDETAIGDRARRVAAFLSPWLVGEIGGAPKASESLRDHLIKLAAVSSAPLITDDDVLAPSEYTVWRHTDHPSGRPAFAIRSWSFIDAHIDVAPFSLDDVPFNTLELAMRGVR